MTISSSSLIGYSPPLRQEVAPEQEEDPTLPSVMKDPWLENRNIEFIENATGKLLPEELCALVLEYSVGFIGTETGPILKQLSEMLKVAFPKARSDKERIRGFLNAPVFENWNGFVSPQDMVGYSVKRIMGIADGTIAHGVVCVFKESINRFNYVSFSRIHKKKLFSPVQWQSMIIHSNLYYYSLTRACCYTHEPHLSWDPELYFTFKLLSTPDVHYPDKQMLTQGPNVAPALRSRLKAYIEDGANQTALEWMDLLSLTTFRNHHFDIIWTSKAGKTLTDVQSLPQQMKNKFLKNLFNSVVNCYLGQLSTLSDWTSDGYRSWIDSGNPPLLLDSVV